MTLEQIHPNPKNPRFLRKEKSEWLEDSLNEFGDLSGYVFRKGGMIISAHQRWEKIKPKVKEVVVRETFKTPLPDGTIERGHFELNDGTKHDYSVRDWTPEKADRATIRANAQNAGEWDADVLANQWEYEPEVLQDMGVPEWVFGEDRDDEDAVKLEAKEDEYEPPAEIITDIVTGDLFEIGRHRLLCGDSTSADDVGRLLNGEKPFLMVTDPPYGVAYVGKTKDALKIQNDAMSEEQTHGLWRDCLSAIWPFLREGGGIYATVPPGQLQLGFMQVMKDFEALRQVMVWNKGSMVLGHSDYHYKHEPVLYGWKPGAAHYFTDDRTQTTVLDVEKPAANREHPTMKPVKLWEIFITNSSKAGWEIYDPFLGSGTTMVAAHQLNRRCYGMEIDPKYCQVIVDRMLKLDPTLEIKRNGQPYQK